MGRNALAAVVALALLASCTPIPVGGRVAGMYGLVLVEPR